MELLCPNCQKKLTVPDQYAGQVMKCPLCAGTFTTPSLPPAPGPAYVAPPMPAAPAPAPIAVTPLPPAGPNLSLPAADVEIMAGPPDHRDLAPVSWPAAPPPVTGDYRHRGTVWLSPRVLPWLAVGALVLVFVLTFFPWVGFYPGGITVTSQNAWQAAFGSYSVVPEWESQSPTAGKEAKDRVEPSASVLLIFFLLFLIVALLAALAAALLGVLTVSLPPFVQQLKPWWWAIVSALSLAALLFLVFQLLGGFSLVNKARQSVDNEMTAHTKDAPADVKRVLEVQHASVVNALRQTGAFWLALFLTVVALVCAAMTFWLERRPGHPLPRLEVMW
jgi:hypothetical protein